MAQVKGIAVLGLIKFIKKNMKDALPKIVASLPPETKKYMDEHILLTEWYPYKLYTDLLKTMDKVIGRGDLSYCIEQGRLSAQHDLSTVYRIFLNFVSPRLIVTKAMSIWNSYYDAGQVEAGMLADNGISVTIKEFPDIDIAHVKNAQGWLEQFLVMCKFKEVKSGIEKCQCYGDPFTELRFTYKSQGG
ncbi:MAG: hypothetical protein M1491_09305 [Deltaproteobacteria bacterium]|nr:hypothetical protein [Deltaproteobacteria bacterium]MCL5276773.1 hypothetical protein [Deltaproteobacteria bacterium]